MTKRGFIVGIAASIAALFGSKASAQTRQIPNQTEIDAIHQRVLGALPYEKVTVPGRDAFEHWQQLKAQENGWPVVIGGDEDLLRVAEQYSIDDPQVFGARQPQLPSGLDIPLPPIQKPLSPEEILAKATSITIPATLTQEFEANYGDDYHPEIGEWPDQPQQALSDEQGLTVAVDILHQEPYEQVHILIIPTEHGWQVPAYLRWGNWNACPPPEVHVAALKSWHERYGAELVGISPDVLNLRVSHRPESRDEAEGLAIEQFHYCPDIVDQGVGSVRNLAEMLKDQDWWYFWWD